MAIDLNKVIDRILIFEGGYVNDPLDRGGATNRGITQATLSSFLNRPASIEDVKNLTEETARYIYIQNYIRAPGIDQLPEAIIPVVADASVLYGQGRSVIFVQRVVNFSGFGPITVDGGIGPKTIAAAASCYEGMGHRMANAIVDERIAFCNRIVANNPSQSRFIVGWTTRANFYRLKG